MSHSSRWLEVLFWQSFEEAFCAPKVRLKWYGFKAFPSRSSHCSGGLFPQYSGCSRAGGQQFRLESGCGGATQHLSGGCVLHACDWSRDAHYENLATKTLECVQNLRNLCVLDWLTSGDPGGSILFMCCLDSWEKRKHLNKFPGNRRKMPDSPWTVPGWSRDNPVKIMFVRFLVYGFFFFFLALIASPQKQQSRSRIGPKVVSGRPFEVGQNAEFSTLWT